MKQLITRPHPVSCLYIMYGTIFDAPLHTHEFPLYHHYFIVVFPTEHVQLCSHTSYDLIPKCSHNIIIYYIGLIPYIISYHTSIISYHHIIISNSYHKYQPCILYLPSGNLTQLLKMGKSPFSYGFPTVFLWFFHENQRVKPIVGRNIQRQGRRGQTPCHTGQVVCATAYCGDDVDFGDGAGHGGPWR